MINQINRNVLIGDEQDAASIKALRQNKITGIVNLTTLHIDLKLDQDAIDQVNQAIESVDLLVRNGNRTLVHCHAGIDRAPFVVAMYLHKTTGTPFSEAYDFVKSKRPQTIQHYEWAKPFLTDREVDDIS